MANNFDKDLYDWERVSRFIKNTACSDPKYDADAQAAAYALLDVLEGADIKKNFRGGQRRRGKTVDVSGFTTDTAEFGVALRLASEKITKNAAAVELAEILQEKGLSVDERSCIRYLNELLPRELLPRELLPRAKAKNTHDVLQELEARATPKK